MVAATPHGNYSAQSERGITSVSQTATEITRSSFQRRFARQTANANDNEKTKTKKKNKYNSRKQISRDAFVDNAEDELFSYRHVVLIIIIIEFPVSRADYPNAWRTLENDVFSRRFAEIGITKRYRNNGACGRETRDDIPTDNRGRDLQGEPPQEQKAVLSARTKFERRDETFAAVLANLIRKIRTADFRSNARAFKISNERKTDVNRTIDRNRVDNGVRRVRS